MANTFTLKIYFHCLTTTETQTINNQHADATLGKRVSYAHVLCVDIAQ